MKLTISAICFILCVIINNYELVSAVSDSYEIYGLKDKCVTGEKKSLLSNEIKYYKCKDGFRRFYNLEEARKICIKMNDDGWFDCSKYDPEVGLKKMEDIEAECIVKKRRKLYICYGRGFETYTSKMDAQEKCIKKGDDGLYYCNMLTKNKLFKQLSEII
ncbi:uncharacterized protein LOC127290327 [Leptopilina boulardi]|uniref:uncharacterized protein LOC127290327 n=1 Tax=Leptopilina boulardi TaxID=63433 RepID=UPI0021F551E8|nr:uncharacterized protein LOC127290327 [Leptopilina boulardi]